MLDKKFAHRILKDIEWNQDYLWRVQKEFDLNWHGMQHKYMILEPVQCSVV